MAVWLPAGVEVVADGVPGAAEVLTPAALDFVADLERTFRSRRAELLARRAERQARIDRGATLQLLAETTDVRAADWRVAEAPPDLLDRRCEITGPAEPKMMINALNSGARVFMADLEDALSPTWSNVVGGQAALRHAVRGTLAVDAPDGRRYRLAERVATLVVRPRGWHLADTHVRVDGAPVSASLLDAGLFLFHNAREQRARGTGPYFYLAKLESHLEARLWNDVFLAAQAALGIPRGTIRATVLVETIPAAFEMDEILWELREHAAGLNAGRWDYLFSCIKTFRARSDLVLPDRSRLTMTTPFMRAYTDRLVRTCHRRGAHAIGGMAAYIPSRRDPGVNTLALARVREDKERESRDGFDGTWVAHPDLVPLAGEVFDDVLGGAPHQKARLPADGAPPIDRLLDLHVADAAPTEDGARLNVSVALAYLDAWLAGSGAVAIRNLMEDTATAEISRSQLWHWRVTGVPLDDGRPLALDRYRAIRDEELAALGGPGGGAGNLDRAAALLDDLVLGDNFLPFLTIAAYPLLG